MEKDRGFWKAAVRMKWGSLFSGIGGFDQALRSVGWETAWMIENDKNCQKLLKEKFPGVPIYGDITKLNPADLAPVDGICGGWPCQDLSFAGKRKGLAGERSGLFREVLRFVKTLKPKWIFLENVVGLLSSKNGEDMRFVIQSLWELGYMGSWRMLDSQYFGVPQKRRRIFFVANLGNESKPEILLEPEICLGNVKKIEKMESQGLCISCRDGQKQYPTDETIIAGTLRANYEFNSGSGGGGGNFIASCFGAKQGWRGSSEENFIGFALSQDARNGISYTIPTLIAKINPIGKRENDGLP